MNWLKACLSKAKGWIVERWNPTLIVIGIGLVPFILWKVPEWQVRAYHGRLDAGAIRQLNNSSLYHSTAH